MIPIRELGVGGVISDLPPYELPPNAVTFGENVEFRDGAIERSPGLLRECPVPGSVVWFEAWYSGSNGKAIGITELGGQTQFYELCGAEPAPVTVYGVTSGAAELLEYGSPTGMVDMGGFFEPLDPNFITLFEMVTGEPRGPGDNIIPEGAQYDSAYFAAQLIVSSIDIDLRVRSYGGNIASLSAEVSGPDAGNYTVTGTSISGDEGAVTVAVSVPDVFVYYIATIAVTVTLDDGSSHVLTYHPHIEQVAF